MNRVEEIENHMMDNGWLVRERPNLGDEITGHDDSPEYGGDEAEYEAHVTRVFEDGSCLVYYVSREAGLRTDTERTSEPVEARLAREKVFRGSRIGRE